MTFENNTVVTIKLASGEELIGRFKEQSVDESNDHYLIEKPLAMMMGPQGLAFATFAPTMDHTGGVKIARQNVVAIGKTLEKVAGEYGNATSQIKTPPKPNLVVS